MTKKYNLRCTLRTSKNQNIWSAHIKRGVLLYHMKLKNVRRRVFRKNGENPGVPYFGGNIELQGNVHRKIDICEEFVN